MLGSDEEARRWVREPAVALKQQRPIDLVATKEGSQLVLVYLEDRARPLNLETAGYSSHCKAGSTRCHNLMDDILALGSSIRMQPAST